MEKIAARASGAVYRYSKKPVTLGEVRKKAWQWLIPPNGDTDPVWAARCKAYWELQQETYGLLFSDFTMTMDWEARVIVTYAVVIDVLPGERRVDYVVPAVFEARRRLQLLDSSGSKPEAEIRQAKDVDPAKRACPSCGAVGGAHRAGCAVTGGRLA
jgi:hypothetical protein